MKKLINLDYKSVFKYFAVFCLFILFNNLQTTVMPYSLALLSTLFCFNCSIILTPILFLCAFFVFGDYGLIAPCSISCIFLMLITFIYRKTKTKIRYEIIFFTALSTIPFIILGSMQKDVILAERILFAIITTLLSFFCYASQGASKKGLKYKLGYDEFASIGVFVFCLGLGFSNVISPLVWQGISIFLILLVANVYKKGVSLLVSGVLGVSLCVYYGNITYVSLFIFYALIAESLMPFSRHVAGLSLILLDYVIHLIFNFYGAYLLQNFLCVLIGAMAFCVLPSKPLKALKERLYSFREKQLARVSINRNRLMMSNRLFELSSVFNEMSEAFNAFKKNAMNEDVIKSSVKKEITSSVCSACPNSARCEIKKDSNPALDKMIEIGFAKGKLSLIDLPKEVGEKCISGTNVLFCANKLLASYRAYLTEHINLETGRSLIATETAGVAEILRSLALEEGTTLKYQSRLERKLNNELLKNGFMVSELLIYGENQNLSIGMIITQNEFSLGKLVKTIKNVVGLDMMLAGKSNISDEKFYLSFRKSVKYDAVFGVASATKDNSEKSGDTHSILRIGTDKFLVALSDGMGSGEKAQNISSVSLSLIESFYKAGMNSELILGTVNKLLSVNTEDSFTALDVSVINLNSCQADFIKYGSPYGFIVGENGIKILEGNTLPLGILEELKPSVCSVKLCPNDVVVFVSDGISDAFGSSAEVIDFLRTVPAKNPQSLADDILAKAIELEKGEKKDDMTVLSVRVFPLTSHTA